MAEIKSYSLDDFVKNVSNGLKGQGPFGSYDHSVLESMLNNIDGSINKARQEINQLAVKNKQDTLRKSVHESLEFKTQLGEIEKAFGKYGFGTAYEFNERDGKLVVHIQPRDSANFTAQQRKDFERDIKIEFDTDVNQFGITTRNKQIASDNMRLRTHGGKTVLLSGIQSLAKDFNDAFAKVNSQLNKSLEYKNAAAINRAIKDIVNTHNNHTATTGSNNFIKKDLKNERLQDNHRLKVSGKITPQQLNYSATKGAAIYYGDFLNDIVKETKASILKKQQIEKAEYARAEQMVIEDLNQILALSSTQNWQKNANGGSDQLDAFLGSMLGNKKYFTAKDKKTIINYLSSAALNGGGYGLGNEYGYAQHRFTPNRASGSAPFGFGYARENRSWMQAQSIATPRGRNTNRNNSLVAYNAGKAGRALVTSAYQQQLQQAYKKAQAGNQIDFSSEDQYNFAQISQAGLDRGLKAVEAQIKQLQSSAKKEDHARAKRLQKEYLKFKDLGITEGGMILKGDMKDELLYTQEINRALHSDVNFQKMVEGITDEELAKYKNRKPFNKTYIKSLKDKGLDEAGITAALKEKLAVYKLFGRDLKDPHRDFSYERVLDRDNNVTGFKILQQMMGQNAHRAVTDTGMRVAPSFSGPHSNEIFDIILKELGFSGDSKTIAGFIGMEKNYSDRKVGEQINGVLKRAVLEMEQAQTIGNFVQQFNKKYGKNMMSYDAKNGLVYNQDVVNSVIDNGNKSQNMYDFYERFFTLAGKNKATNPYEFKNGTAFLKDPDLLIQTMGINNSDIWTYGSAHNKGGKWMSVDNKVIGSLNRMLGEGDESKKSIINAIKKSYPVSEEDYDKTIKAVENSYKLSYSDDNKVSEKTLELDLKTLQQKYKEYADIKDKYTTDGRLSVEAFNASPLAWIQGQIQAKADELGVAKEEINAFVRLENGFELKDPYSGNSARSTALPINVFRGQKNFGSIEEIRDEMGEIQGEIVQDVEGTSLDIINSFISKTFLSSAEAQEKAALDYIKEEGNYFYSKEGGYFNKAHHGRLAHGAALTAIGTNLKSGNEFLENGGLLVSPNQLRGMLKTQSGDSGEMSENIVYLSNILGKMNIGDKRRLKLADKLKNAKDDQERESILANEVVRAVDITAKTDKDLNFEGGQRGAAFKNAELLTLMNLRYPLIYGQDVGFGSLAVSKNIEDSAIAMSMGNYRARNADFDADKITIALISSILKKSQDEQGNDYFAKGKEVTRRLAQTTNKYIQREYKDDEKDKETKGIFNNTSLGRTDSLDGLIETLSRSNRSQIGSFSLINQAIREGMTYLGLDEASQTGETAAQAALVRELFTSLEQDAISAKKLSKRFQEDDNLKKYIKDGKLNAEGSEYLYKELENLKIQAFGENSKVFKDKKATMNWLAQLQEFGVLGADDKALFGAGKTQGRLNALFSALDPTQVKEVLGVTDLDDFLNADHDLKITREMLANALIGINAKWEGSNQSEYKGGFGDVIRYKNKILNNYSSMTDYQLWKKYGPALASSQVMSDIYTPAQVDSSGLLGGFGGGSGKGDVKVPKQYSDKLTGKEVFSDKDLSVTTLLNTVFRNNFPGFTRQDYHDYNSISTDEQYKNWIDSLQGSTPEQKEANARRILKEGWLYSGAGTYRHGLAQTKLMAQKFGIDNLDITNLENIKQAATGNNKFSKWLNEVDKNSGLNMLQSLANYEFLAKKYYGEGTVDYLSALSGNQQGAQNYYDMVMKGAQELLGSETTIRGKWGGRNVQGKIDFLRTAKRRNPYDAKSPEKLFLDVIDFKPGMTKAQYVAQFKKYSDMLKPYEELAQKHGKYGKGTGIKRKDAFEEFAKEGLISQFIADNGKEMAQSLFRVMTDKNYAGVLDVGAWDDKTLSVMTQGLYSLDEQGKVIPNKHNEELLNAIGYAFANNLDISEIFSDDDLARLTKHDKIANTEITKPGDFKEYWNKLQKRERLNTDIATLQAKIRVATDSEKREKYEQSLIQKQEELSKFNEDNNLLFNQYKDLAPDLEKTLLSGTAESRQGSVKAVYGEQLGKLYSESRVGHGKAEDLKAKLGSAKLGSAEAEELRLALNIQNKINDSLQERINKLETIKSLNGEGNLFTQKELDKLKEEDKLLQEKEDHIRKAKLAEGNKAQLESLYKQQRVGHGREEDIKMKMLLAGKDKSANGRIVQQELALAYQDQQKINEELAEQIEDKEKASKLSKEELDKIKQPEIERTKVEDSIRNAKYLQSEKDGTVRGFFANFGPNFAKGAKQFLMYQLSFNALFQKLKQGIKTVENQVKNMNKALVDLQIVTGGTREETISLLNSYTKLGKELGATTTEVANAANAWLRQGYEAADVTELITSSLYLSKLGMIDSAQATQNLTSMLKGFKLEASDAISVVDKLVSVDMKAAASAGGIAEALSQFATTAQLSGLDMDKAIAMATTIMDVSQAAPSSAGNALKTILSRFGNVKAGAFEDMGEGEESTSINDVERVIKTLGISLRDVKGELRDFSDVLEDIAEKWETIDEVSKNALATAFAGTRQRESFLVLMENMDKYHDLIEVSANSAGTAVKKYDSYSDNLEASQKRVAAAWEELGNNANLQNLMIKANDFIEKLINILPTVIKWTERIASLRIGAKVGQLLGSKIGQGITASNIMANPVSNKTSIFGKLLGVQGYNFNNNQKQSILNSLFVRAGELAQEIKNNTIALRGNTVVGKQNNQQKNPTMARISSFGEPTKSLQYTYGKNTYQINPATGESYKVLKNGELSVKGSSKLFKNLSEQDYNTLKTNLQDTITYSTRQLEGYHLNEEGKWVSDTTGKVVNNEEFQKLFNDIKSKKDTASKQLEKLKKQDPQKRQKGAAAASAMIQMGSAMAMGGIMGSQNYAKSSTFKDSTGKEIQAAMTEGEEATSRTWSTISGVASGIPLIGPVFSALYDASVKNNWGNKYGVSRGLASAEQEAANRKKTLNAVSNNISKFAQAATSGDLDAGKEQLDDMISSLYKRDEEGNDVNKAGREQYEKYLKDILGENFGSNLLEITRNVEGDVAKQRELSQAMLIAQEQANRENLIASNAKESSQRGKAADQAWAKYKDSGYQEKARKAGIGTGIGVGTAVGVGSAAAVLGAGAAIAGGLASIPIAGWIAAGATLVVTGVTAGIVAAKDAQLKKEAEYEAQNAERGKTYTDKILEVEQAIDLAKKEGDTKAISELQDIKDTLQQIEIEQEQYYKELDESYAREGILGAKFDEDYIANFSEAQLKQNVGKTGIEKAFGEYLEKQGGLYNADVFSTDGTLSEYARSLLKAAVKENAVLNSVYTGEAYSLSEALTRNDTELLQNFATALGVSINALKGMEDQFGRVKLGDFMSNIDDLNKKISKLTDNITFLTDSTKTQYEKEMIIINQYPELINIMGNTPALLKEFWSDLGQLANVEAEKLVQEIYDSEEYYTKTLLPKLQENDTFKTKFDTVGDSLSKVTSIEGLMQYLTRNGDNDFTKAIQQIISKNLEDVDAIIDVYRDLFDKADEFKIHLLDEQLNNLQSQKEALEQINSQREYENKLLDARNKLESALNEKKRVWREGVGWVYETDQEALAEAEQQLDSLNTEKQISSIEETIKQIEAEKRAIEEKKDKEKWDQLQDLYESYFGPSSNSKSVNAYIEEVKEAVKGINIDIGGVSGSINEDIEAKEKARNEFLKGVDGKGGLSAAKSKLVNLSAQLEGKDKLNITNEQRKEYNDALEEYNNLRTEAISKGYITSDSLEYQSTSSMSGSVTANLYNGGAKVKGQDIFLTNDRENGSGSYRKYMVGDILSAESQEAKSVYGDMTNKKKYAHGFLPDGSIIYFWNGNAYSVPGAGGMNKKDRAQYELPDFAVGDATDLASYAKKQPNIILVGAHGNDEIVVIKDGNLLSASDNDMTEEEKQLMGSGKGGSYYLNGSGTRSGAWEGSSVGGNALGNLSFAGGPTFVNELGTEAIITPHGTITSLPSATGIVPADITKNLWQLGELAPAIVQGLMMPGFGFNSVVGAKANQSSVDESFNITTLNMNVTADDSFDADAFVKAIRTRAELSRNNR